MTIEVGAKPYCPLADPLEDQHQAVTSGSLFALKARRMALFCPLCYRRTDLQPLTPGLTVCALCRSELAELCLPFTPRTLGVGPLGDTHSLYLYAGIVRAVILRAKVQGDLRAVQILLKLALSRLRPSSLLTWPDALTPSPASLWSRSRGRLDIAAALTAALARQSHRPQLPAPWHLHWRWQKNAQRRADERTGLGAGVPPGIARWSETRYQRSLERLHPCQYSAAVGGGDENAAAATSPRIHLLLIDDVLTSGVTLQSLAAAVAAPEVSVRALTFAASTT